MLYLVCVQEVALTTIFGLYLPKILTTKYYLLYFESLFSASSSTRNTYPALLEYVSATKACSEIIVLIGMELYHSHNTQ